VAGSDGGEWGREQVPSHREPALGGGVTRHRALCWWLDRALCVASGAAGACDAPGHGLALGDGDRAGGERQLAAVAAQLHRGRVGAEGQHQGRGAGEGDAQRVLAVANGRRASGSSTSPAPGLRGTCPAKDARGCLRAAGVTPGQAVGQPRVARRPFALGPNTVVASSPVPTVPRVDPHTAARNTAPVAFASLLAGGARCCVGGSCAHLLQGRDGGNSHAGGRHAGLGRRNADAGEGAGLQGGHLCV
jgi:hypothetical protein